MFLWKRKIKKNERIEENYATTFSTWSPGLYADVQKLFWSLSFRNTIESWAFLPLTGPKKDLILAPRNNWFWLILEQGSVCIGAQQVKYFRLDKYMFKVRKRKAVAAKYVQS